MTVYRYLSAQLVEDMFPGLTVERLARWRWAKTGPSYVSAGRQRLYRQDVVEAFLESHTVIVGGEGSQP